MLLLTQSMLWRHWGWYVSRDSHSTTERVLSNIKKEVEDDAKELVRALTYAGWI